jgi:hypothetical protein
MDSEDLIKSMKEVIRCYEMCNDPKSPMINEIHMWRDRFLKENIEKVYHETGRAQAYFSAIPSENLMKKTPEEWLEECINPSNKTGF